MTSQHQRATFLSIRKKLSRVVLWPSWVALATLTWYHAAGLSVPTEAQYLPLLASTLLFGLPHGAVDHLVALRLWHRIANIRNLTMICAGYLTAASAYLALWFFKPPVALALFIVITWFHWGQGELYSLSTFIGVRHLESRTRRALTLVLRGGIPMLIPLIAFPRYYRTFLDQITGLFQDVPGDATYWIFSPDFRLCLAAGITGLSIIYLLPGWRKDALSSRAIDAAEVLLLVFFFATVPPVLAVGVYFCLWHSLRHLGRLMIFENLQVLREGRLSAAIANLGCQATPLTLVALLLLAGLYLMVPEAQMNTPALVGLYLVLLSALTLPHTLVVCWMDWQQGLWKHT